MVALLPRRHTGHLKPARIRPRLYAGHPLMVNLYAMLPMTEYGGLPKDWAPHPQIVSAVGVGMPWVSTVRGPGLHGQGTTGDYVSIPTHKQATDFSRAILVVPHTIPSQGLITTRVDSTTYERSIGISAGSKFEWYCYDGSARSVVSTTTPVAGTAYMVVGTQTGSSMFLYVNGVQEATGTCNGGYTGYTNPFLSIGWGGLAAGGSFVTDADIVGVWDWTRALRASEVAAFSAEPYIMVQARTLARWPMAAAVAGGGFTAAARRTWNPAGRAGSRRVLGWG